ncbi:aconitase X catalytic domain-containing protein [Rhodobacteraceae bacterium NNCM2]|nr:aconitase X catalytic domain-containing protein [Coraliihabitans acroporae]
MDLTDLQKSWLNGDAGAALQWAMDFNLSLARFYDAPQMLPVASAHFAPDARMSGRSGVDLLQRFADEDAAIRVPGYLDPCHIDFEKEAEIIAERGVSRAFVEEEKRILMLCRRLGFLPTQSCIPFQSVSPPLFGSHLAWGDTGAAISANSIFGARSNFEGGPSALASALVGATPAYGFHLDRNRRANLVIRVDCAPGEIADWGAIARWAGQIATGYDTVPVFHGDFPPPSFDMLKQLGVALASYGGHAMFHVVSATPEAMTLEQACQGKIPAEEDRITRRDLDTVFLETGFESPSVDLVVFAAPQLSIDEVTRITAAIGERRVHADTRLIMAVDHQVKHQADQSGLTERVRASGAEFTIGTCFYPEAPLMREGAGWRTVVTNSAKLMNTLASAGYETALRRLDDCLDAATTGRLAS